MSSTCDIVAANVIRNPDPTDGRLRGPDPARIRSMFATIAARYDRANTVLSGGIHHRWRTATVAWSMAQRGDRVLDCATGTGDLAVAFERVVGPDRVTGTDFTPEMIDLARAKAPGITFDVADVTDLPFETAAFDIASISFGIRNVGDPQRALAELARVVRPGGRVMVLELGSPGNPVFRAFYNLYRRRVLPLVGGLVTGQRSAYEYLEDSAGRFPSGDDFVRLMYDGAGFSAVDFQPLSLGIAYLYRGVKG